MAKPDHRLQLARRIHQVLVQQIDHEIEVERLLVDPRYARDVLLVCDALAGTEAPPLATQFRQLPTPVAAAAGVIGPAGAPGHARQPHGWSRDTSGFGVTHPPPMAAPPGPPRPADELPQDQTERRRGWLPRWRG